MRRLGPIIALALFGLIGYFGYRVAGQVAAYVASRSTSGVVLESSVREIYNKGRYRARGHFSYRPTISYRYELDGKTHESSNIRLYQVAEGSRSYAKALAKRFSVGKRVKVYVTTVKGSRRSYLLREVDDRGFYAISFAGALAFFLLWLSSTTVRRPARQPTDGRGYVTFVMEPSIGRIVLRAKAIGVGAVLFSAAGIAAYLWVVGGAGWPLPVFAVPLVTAFLDMGDAASARTNERKLGAPFIAHRPERAKLGGEVIVEVTLPRAEDTELELATVALTSDREVEVVTEGDDDVDGDGETDTDHTEIYRDEVDLLQREEREGRFGVTFTVPKERAASGAIEDDPDDAVISWWLHVRCKGAAVTRSEYYRLGVDA